MTHDKDLVSLQVPRTLTVATGTEDSAEAKSLCVLFIN
jgi:hypothetical protein